MAEKGNITAPVRRFFSENPDCDVYIDTIVKDTGFSRKQVLNAIAGRRYAGDPIEPVVGGQIYRWHSGHAPGRADAVKVSVPKTADAQGDMFLVRQIGTLSGGEMILQDEETRVLYRATQLK